MIWPVPKMRRMTLAWPIAGKMLVLVVSQH